MKSFIKIIFAIFSFCCLISSQKTATATLDPEIANDVVAQPTNDIIIPWLFGCRRHPIYGYCYDFGGLCKNQRQCCRQYFDICTNQYKCGCKNCKGCHYDQKLHSCRDASNECNTKQCCKFTFKYGLDGKPICKCIKRESPIGAPCSQCQWNGRQCLDQTDECNPTNGQCCKHYYHGGYQGSTDIASVQSSAYANFLPVYIYYGICLCRKDAESCQSCRFDKEKAQCVSTDGKCACCKIVEPFVIQTGTGLPKCYCQSVNQVCNTCQRSNLNSLICKGSCDNKNQCCKLIKLSIGVEFCDCDQCPGCKYNATKRSCENTGLCQYPDCCKEAGYQNGEIICKCAVEKKQWCDTCVWDGKKCYDPHFKCTGNKCCVSKYNDSICSCQICPIQPKCKFNRDYGRCVSYNDGCFGENCCVLTGKLYSNGQPECQCISSIDQRCNQCQFYQNAVGQKLCMDKSKRCLGQKCCLKQVFQNNIQYCSCQGCTKKRCYWDIFENRCRDTGLCTGDDCCYRSKAIDIYGYPQCFCSQQCGTCYYDTNIGLCVDYENSCVAINKKCTKQKVLGGLISCSCQ